MVRNFFKSALNDTKDSPKNVVIGNNIPKSSVKKINDSLYTKELDFEELTLRKIHLMFFSDNEIEKISINITKEYKDDNTRETISDPRMFPHRNSICSTCELPGPYCAGHLGRINLSYPLINEWSRNYLLSILRSICYRCGSILLDIDTVKRIVKAAEHLKKVADLSKNLPCRNKKCTYYGNINPSFQTARGSFAKLNMSFSDGTIGELNTLQILNILNNISNEELEALGYPQNSIYNNHPRNMLITNLPVITENHRPPLFADNRLRPNFLTNNYQKIIQINNALKSGKNDDNKGIDALDTDVSALFFREKDSKSSVPGGESSKNIKDLISHKKGLIRSYIQAKRADKTGRTVIGPGGLDIPFGYMRIPEYMTKIRVKEMICDSNREYYQSIINELQVEVNGQTLNMDYVRDFKLENGMIINRPIKTGDPIMANRNPTLHKHSMMGYRAKIMPGLSIGLHSSNTAHHKADFDGDEININVPPGYEARAEMLYLAGCWNHIIGSQFSRPMMGLYINGVTGSYLLSKYGNINDKMWDDLTVDFHDLENRNENLKSRYRKYHPNIKNWRNGKTLFSLLLPDNFYYKHAGIKIVNGILEEGELYSKHVGDSTSSIVHQIFNHYGKHFAARFINEGQSLADRFLEYIGFTVGYRDCVMPNEELQVKELVEQQIINSESKIMDLEPLRRNKNLEIQEFYVQSVQGALSTVKELGQRIIKDALSDTNALKIMAKCGAKGGEADIAQVVGVVGQQFIKDQRPPLLYNKKADGEGRRYLPHYDIHHEGYSEKIRNRGFVDRALGKGLRPGHLIAHMTSARDGLIDTALGTADTGYIHHTITQAFEDLRCGYNGSVSDDLGRITQYCFGYDSYDPIHINKVYIPGYGFTWSPFDITTIVEMLNNSD